MGDAIDGLVVRKVPFRDGADDDLAALHCVDSEVQRERRPDLPPQPVGDYIAFARGFPHLFTEWTWLVEDRSGGPVAAAACWFREGHDPNVLEADITVRRSFRRRGVGTSLLRHILDVAKEEKRGVVIGPTLDTVPAGEAFAERAGAQRGSVSRTSSLRLESVDWTMVDEWIRDGPVQAPGYRLEFVVGPFPRRLHADAARFAEIMQTAPRDDLPVADATVEVSHIAEWDALLVKSGATRWTILVRAPDGSCVGGTQVHVEPWDPSTAHQGDTGIDPAHRGRGLGKWVKASMLQRIRDDWPAANRVRTGNAYSNAPMLAINDALGFEVVYSRVEWVLKVSA